MQPAIASSRTAAPTWRRSHSSAVLAGHSDVFDGANASTMTGTRNRLEYLDSTTTVEVTEDEARWAAQLAERAVVDAAAFLS